MTDGSEGRAKRDSDLAMLLTGEDVCRKLMGIALSHGLPEMAQRARLLGAEAFLLHAEIKGDAESADAKKEG
jgi:hypothetical protein